MEHTYIGRYSGILVRNHRPIFRDGVLVIYQYEQTISKLRGLKQFLICLQFCGLGI